MEELEVIHFKSPFESYSWNDGLFAVLKIENDEMHLQKIKDGKLATYDDGTPNLWRVSVHNSGITRTKETIKKI